MASNPIISHVSTNPSILANPIISNASTNHYNKIESLSKSNDEKSDGSKCCVCNLLSSELITTKCDHKYHLSCLKTCIKNDVKCFICSKGLVSEQIKRKNQKTIYLPLKDQYEEIIPSKRLSYLLGGGMHISYDTNSIIEEIINPTDNLTSRRLRIENIILPFLGLHFLTDGDIKIKITTGLVGLELRLICLLCYIYLFFKIPYLKNKTDALLLLSSICINSTSVVFALNKTKSLIDYCIKNGYSHKIMYLFTFIALFGDLFISLPYIFNYGSKFIKDISFLFLISWMYRFIKFGIQVFNGIIFCIDNDYFKTQQMTRIIFSNDGFTLTQLIPFITSFINENFKTDIPIQKDFPLCHGYGSNIPTQKDVPIFSDPVSSNLYNQQHLQSILNKEEKINDSKENKENVNEVPDFYYPSPSEIFSTDNPRNIPDGDLLEPKENKEDVNDAVTVENDSKNPHTDLSQFDSPEIKENLGLDFSVVISDESLTEKNILKEKAENQKSNFDSKTWWNYGK
uniref:RING-type domain-containing protein n=1 Tax=viral metagenome TaxID=1070528 RepID=A0A6C0BC68_9ZZZZ